MRKLRYWFLCAVYTMNYGVHAASILYYLEPRRSFDPMEEHTSTNAPNSQILVAVMPLYEWYQQDVQFTPGSKHEKRMFAGALLNLEYDIHDFWFQMTTALGKETGKFSLDDKRIKISRSGFDDVLFYMGYNFLSGRAFQVIPFIQGGVPTRWHTNSREGTDPLVGSGLYSVGPALELSYNWLETPVQSVTSVLQARVLHFFPRHFKGFRCGTQVYPGNMTDVLCALHYRHTQHHVELGYDLTALTQQKVTPKDIKNTVVNNIYGDYYYQSASKLWTVGGGVWGALETDKKYQLVTVWVFGEFSF